MTAPEPAPKPLVERLREAADIYRPFAGFGDIADLLEEAAQALGNVATWRGDPERIRERERRIAAEEAERNAQDAFEYNCPFECSACHGRSAEFCAKCTACGAGWLEHQYST